MFSFQNCEPQFPLVACHKLTFFFSQSMDEVDFTILAATSVFSDLIDKCPPAEACRDAFDRTAKATIKMANSTGGFGQTASTHTYKSRRQSRGAADGTRLDWGFSPTDISPALSTKSLGPGGNASANVQSSTSSHHRHHGHQSGDMSRQRQNTSQQQQQLQLQQQQQMLQQRFEQHGGQVQQSQMHQYRSTGGLGTAAIKMESDGFSLMQAPPNVARSNASSYEIVGSPDGSMVDPSSMLASPTVGQTAMSPRNQSQQMHSPIQSASMQGTPTTPSAPAYLQALQQQQQQQQQQHQQQQQQQQQQQRRTQQQPGVLTPSSQTFTDLQGMEFLQSLNSNGVGGSSNLVAGGMMDQQIDFGLNFGWEGMHHDFNDGQQLDLFDGFFFGGQQGGTGSGNPGGM